MEGKVEMHGKSVWKLLTLKFCSIATSGTELHTLP